MRSTQRAVVVFGQVVSRTDDLRRSSELINDPQIDAVVIATPVSSHFELAMAALKAGKHVLVEKPLAARSDQARKLVDEAAARNLVLLVDHTFVYTLRSARYAS